MQVRTFQEWSDAGFTIIKGSKSQFRNGEGVPLFTEQQVKAYRKPIGEWGAVYKTSSAPVTPRPNAETSTPVAKTAEQKKPYAGKPASPPPKVDMVAFKNDPLIQAALEDFKQRLNSPAPATAHRNNPKPIRRFSADPVFEDEHDGAPSWMD